MDRDPLSKDRFVKNFGGRLANINGWNGGRNHIIFNLFSGTWPEYLEELGFDLGYAILAKASISKEKYRPGFDISLPLWVSFVSLSVSFGENSNFRGTQVKLTGTEGDSGDLTQSSV